MIIHKIFSYYSNLAILVFCFFAPSALSKTRFSCGHKLIRVSKVHPYVLTQINYPRYVSQLLDIVKGHSDILEIIEIGKVGSEPLYKIITKVPAAYSLKKASARCWCC